MSDFWSWMFSFSFPIWSVSIGFLMICLVGLLIGWPPGSLRFSPAVTFKVSVIFMLASSMWFSYVCSWLLI